ncbi:hypothetical protein [Natrinema salaciae]|uniref:Uncharacterized protein n=1 Tax=Natrinema salaciae TaxID=1186196 RepID=A0A1H9GA83_9EURY|nr:hypothetical protein [Natrinema salaciae]SEQ46989.1 hypothetical protein SAMN04489841_1824 [Natrinema salaciae]
MPAPTLRDHVRPTDSDYPSGIYRVVGTSDETVTLLRVGNADGRRVTTGEIVRVGRDELEGFEPAENPDGTRPLAAVVASKLEMAYWAVRVFGRQLAAQPLPSAVAVAVLATGYFGDRLVSLPDVVPGVLILVGSLGLAYVGSGRLQQ